MINWKRAGDRVLIGAGGALAGIAALAAFAALGGTESALAGLLAIAIGVLVYLFPSLAARQRRVPNIGSVVVVNVLLGWTLIGWAVALAMALRDPRPPAA
jgi:hypothetical protein